MTGVQTCALPISVNLLPQGDFKNPGINTAWAEGFNIPQNQEFQVLSENGQSRLRIENHDAGRQLDYVHAYVRITSEIESLTVSVRMKATHLKVGAEGWHNARIAMSFEGSESGYPSQVPELTADSDWVTKSVDLKVPKGATRLNLQPAMFHCTGVFEIADLTVTPHLAMTTQLADARLPVGMDLNWEKLNYVAGGVTANAKRSQVSLDGIWRFIPAVEGAAEPPKLGWAYLKVPGSWQQRSRGRNTDFVALGGGTFTTKRRKNLDAIILGKLFEDVCELLIVERHGKFLTALWCELVHHVREVCRTKIFDRREQTVDALLGIMK